MIERDYELVFPWAGGCGWTLEDGDPCARQGTVEIRTDPEVSGVGGFGCDKHRDEYVKWAEENAEGASVLVRDVATGALI